MSKLNEISIVLIGNNGEEFLPDFRTPLVENLNPSNENVHVEISFENNRLKIQRNDESKIVFRVSFDRTFALR